MLVPLNKRVLVRQDIKAATSSGGIIVSTEPEKMNTGIVVGLSSDVETDVVQVGSKVLLGQYPSITVSVDGEELLMVKEDELLGVFRSE